MEDENNAGNEADLSADELAAQQADEAAAQDGDGVDNGEGADGNDGDGAGDEGNDQPDPDKPEPAKAQLPKGVQKRIDKITRQKYEYERQVASLQQQLAQRPEAQQADVTRPTLEGCEFDEGKYIDELTDWKVGEAMKSQSDRSTASQQQARQNEVLQDFEARRQQTLVQGVTAHDDFEEVAIDNPDLTITPQMADIITDSPVGHEIAYHLGKNVQDAANIAQLSPLKQAAAIARLEAQLTGTPKKKISTTGKPVKPVGGKGKQTTKLDPVKDYAKWADARNKEEAGR